MTDTPYNWDRWWNPRDRRFAFDTQGFLLPPGSGDRWFQSGSSEVVGFDALVGFPCLVLLGEPGIGKSFAFAHAETRTRCARMNAAAWVVSCNLKSYSSDALLVQDVFCSAEFRAWQQEGGELHLLLDSFDECLYRIDSLAALLADRFRRLQSIQGLFLRIASHTAEWQTSLEDALCRKWGKEHVGIYELAPLTRDQVRVSASRHSQPPSPSPSEQVELLLASFEAGDVDAWWKLCNLLEVHEDGTWSERLICLEVKALPGWEQATDAVKRRIVRAAGTYVCARGAEPEEWFSKRNVPHYPAIAGLQALCLLASEARPAFDTLPAQVWAAWMPALLRLHLLDESEHRFLVSRAFELAKEAAREWTLKVLQQEHEEYDQPLVLHRFSESCGAELAAPLLAWLSQPAVKPRFVAECLRFLLERETPGALDFARARLSQAASPDAAKRETAVGAAGLLMVHGEHDDWAHIWQVFRRDACFGRVVLEGLSDEAHFSPAKFLRTLQEPDVGVLWEWMLIEYPPAQDPDRRSGGLVTTRAAMADFRDRLLSHLMEMGSAAACGELRRLTDAYPQHAWLRQLWLQGLERMRRQTWQPVSPSALFQLAASRRARLIESGDQLLDAILGSLELLQEELRGKRLPAQFVWEGQRPLGEESISNWITWLLEKDLQDRGVVVDREVQVHLRDKTDILVTAVMRGAGADADTAVSVISEVKGCWHPELKTAMESQLAERYLKDNECRHGLYLVAWFNPNEWDEEDSRRGQVHFGSRHDLDDFLAKETKRLSNNDRTIKSRVLDFSRRATSATERSSAAQRGKRRRRRAGDTGNG